MVFIRPLLPCGPSGFCLSSPPSPNPLRLSRVPVPLLLFLLPPWRWRLCAHRCAVTHKKANTVTHTHKHAVDWPQESLSVKEDKFFRIGLESWLPVLQSPQLKRQSSSFLLFASRVIVSQSDRDSQASKAGLDEKRHNSCESFAPGIILLPVNLRKCSR